MSGIVKPDFTALNSDLDLLVSQVAALKAGLASDDVMTWRNALFGCANTLGHYTDQIAQAADDASAAAANIWR